MAAPCWRAVLCGCRRWRGFSSSAVLGRRTPPLGPMPNRDIDVSNLERLEKYRSFDRYRRRAEQEAQAPHWWRTYREHFGEKTGTGRLEQGLQPPPGELRGPAGVFPGRWASLAGAPVDAGEAGRSRLQTCVHYRQLNHARIFHIFCASFLENSLPLLLEFQLLKYWLLKS
ncbi:large ribosomal subunit protein mL38-like [Hylobates moloch]|uniref:large ribosomal subunit protein mL38-like n=1 Tax=Hylobates moloch TaxID=81572 RepID=UPI0013634D57|nr:large ribosomal subunit protein mL38-like [Hylobates moloch]